VFRTLVFRHRLCLWHAPRRRSPGGQRSTAASSPVTCPCP